MEGAVQRIVSTYGYRNAWLAIAIATIGCAFTALVSMQPAFGASDTPNGTSDAARSLASVVTGDYIVRNFTFGDKHSLSTIRLHYRTLGRPHRGADGRIDNAVLLLHGTGQSGEEFLSPQFSEPLYGRSGPLNAEAFYIILPDSVGNGDSSKPSDGLRMAFPHYDYTDMVRLQHVLVHDALHIDKLRLVLGTSMGCMHTYLWGEMFSGEVRALMAMSCSPFPVAGENWFWRQALIQSIKTDPAWNGGNYTSQPALGMRGAAMFAAIALAGAPNIAATLPTEKSVDERIETDVERGLKTLDANDSIYQWSASRGYDAWPKLDKIDVPVLWWDSADDFINPPTLPYPALALKRRSNFRYKLQAASAETHGHLTFEYAKFFASDLADLLHRSNGDR